MCNEKGQSALRVFPPILLISYPFAVHFGFYYGRLWPALSILLMILLLPLWYPSPHRYRWLGLTMAALLVLALILTPLQESLLLYLAPPAVLLLLLVMFARTLLPGQTPLVTRIAALMHDSLSSSLCRYTRFVTWAWVVFIGTMLCEVIWLALFADAERWSLYTNFINYFLVAGFFLLEFALRRVVLVPEERIGFIAFLRALVRIDFKTLSRQ